MKKPESMGGKTLLCVEDEDLQLKLRTLLFESAGFNVLAAQSAAEGIDAVRNHQVDLVLMDYSLSDKNGAAVAEEMNKIRPGLPVVILSGSPSLPETGNFVDLWLRKADIEPETLVQEVTRLIERRSLGN